MRNKITRALSCLPWNQFPTRLLKSGWRLSHTETYYFYLLVSLELQPWSGSGKTYPFSSLYFTWTCTLYMETAGLPTTLNKAVEVSGSCCSLCHNLKVMCDNLKGIKLLVNNLFFQLFIPTISSSGWVFPPDLNPLSLRVVCLYLHQQNLTRAYF